MNSHAFVFISILVALVALFALVMYLSLRFRRTSFQRALEIRAQDIWRAVPDGWNFADLLYGILQDFSATELGVIVRDHRDQEVGRISFHTGAREQWITLSAGGKSFHADSLRTFRQTIALRRSGDASQTICTFRRVGMANFQVDAQGVGIIESKRPKGFRIAPIYEYRLNGQLIGLCQHIGGWQDRGTWMVLSSTVPVPIRMFILAVQRMRA